MLPLAAASKIETSGAEAASVVPSVFGDGSLCFPQAGFYA